MPELLTPMPEGIEDESGTHEAEADEQAEDIKENVENEINANTLVRKAKFELALDEHIDSVIGMGRTLATSAARGDALDRDSISGPYGVANERRQRMHDAATRAWLHLNPSERVRELPGRPSATLDQKIAEGWKEGRVRVDKLMEEKKGYFEGLAKKLNITIDSVLEKDKKNLNNELRELRDEITQKALAREKEKSPK